MPLTQPNRGRSGSIWDTPAMQALQVKTDNTAFFIADNFNETFDKDALEELFTRYRVVAAYVYSSESKKLFYVKRNEPASPLEVGGAHAAALAADASSVVIHPMAFNYDESLETLGDIVTLASDEVDKATSFSVVSPLLSASARGAIDRIVRRATPADRVVSSGGQVSILREYFASLTHLEDKHNCAMEAVREGAGTLVKLDERHEALVLRITKLEAKVADLKAELIERDAADAELDDLFQRACAAVKLFPKNSLAEVVMGGIKSVDAYLSADGHAIDAQDELGWTLLHWAVVLADDALVKWLLKHGIATAIASHAGDIASDFDFAKAYGIKAHIGSSAGAGAGVGGAAPAAGSTTKTPASSSRVASSQRQSKKSSSAPATPASLATPVSPPNPEDFLQAIADSQFSGTDGAGVKALRVYRLEHRVDFRQWLQYQSTVRTPEAGQTALHVAVLFAAPSEVVQYMLRYGADKTVKDGNGETPIDCVSWDDEYCQACFGSAVTPTPASVAP